MFQGTVQFSITRVPGVTNMLFGGDGFHLVALTGPGRGLDAVHAAPAAGRRVAPYIAKDTAPESAGAASPAGCSATSCAAESAVSALAGEA